MKATIASIACLLMAGFVAAAASVEGNNIAVVIQKDVVMSKTGWQFICVPVDGLSIAGGDGGNVDIATFLPVTAYTAGTTVYVLNENGSRQGSDPTFTLTATTENDTTTKSWVASSTLPNTVDSVTKALKPGAVLWVLLPSDARATILADPTPTASVFCGQNRTRAEQGRDGLNGMVAMKNDSSVALKLSGVISADGAKPKTGDEIRTLIHGANDYKIYYYVATGENTGDWWDYSGNNSNNAEIKPGEAFYYRAK